MRQEWMTVSFSSFFFVVVSVDLASFSPTSLESSERVKEQVGASPSASSDKVNTTMYSYSWCK